MNPMPCKSNRTRSGKMEDSTKLQFPRLGPCLTLGRKERTGKASAESFNISLPNRVTANFAGPN